MTFLFRSRNSHVLLSPWLIVNLRVFQIGRRTDEAVLVNHYALLNVMNKYLIILSYSFTICEKIKYSLDKEMAMSSGPVFNVVCNCHLMVKPKLFPSHVAILLVLSLIILVIFCVLHLVKGTCYNLLSACMINVLTKSNFGRKRLISSLSYSPPSRKVKAGAQDSKLEAGA